MRVCNNTHPGMVTQAKREFVGCSEGTSLELLHFYCNNHFLHIVLIRFGDESLSFVKAKFIITSVPSHTSSSLVSSLSFSNLISTSVRHFKVHFVFVSTCVSFVSALPPDLLF